MNIKEFFDIETICQAEYTTAVDKLNSGKLTHFDQQYYLGIKHASQDILHNITIHFKHLLEAAG